MATLILGLGNIIMGDDGFGPRVIERLRSRRLPPSVTLLDGGTGGVDLLPRLEGVRNLIVVDAVDLGKAPGTVRRLTGEEMPEEQSLLSPHQAGLPGLLQLAGLTGVLPERVVLWGVQPERVEPGLELTETMAAQVDAVVARVLDEIEEGCGI